MNVMTTPKPATSAKATTAAMMKALVYQGPGKKALEDRPKPDITAATDAIVKVTNTTICGTDLHILKGDVPTCQPGRILGHEGVGIVEKVGAAVTAFKAGDHVLISCVSACGKCEYCRKQMYSHCTTGGWILGNKIDGTQAEFVRIPYADTRSRGRRSAGDAQRHPANRLRVWCAQRQGCAGEYRGDRRRGADWARCTSHRPVLLAG